MNSKDPQWRPEVKTLPPPPPAPPPNTPARSRERERLLEFLREESRLAREKVLHRRDYYAGRIEALEDVRMLLIELDLARLPADAG
jgi:hypothetical protein